MEERAAKEYSTFLIRRLDELKPTLPSNALWVLILGLPGFFAFESLAGLAFGATLGYGVCAILTNVQRSRWESTFLEFQRHLHEHTDETNAGILRAKIDKSVEVEARKWWK